MSDVPFKALPEPEPESDKARFFKTVGAGLAVAGKAVGRAAMGAGAAAVRGFGAIDPDVKRFAAQAPIFGLSHLIPSHADLADLPDDGHRPVIFVHGLGGHRGNFAAMGWYFAAMGRRRTVWLGFEDKTSIEAMAQELIACARDLAEACALPEDGPGIDLVCHSMGGIVARVALEDPWFKDRVAHLVTLGTPHGGTQLARWTLTHKIRELRPDSPLLDRLSAQIPWDDTMPPLTCFWSPSDLVIMPPESACVDGATKICAEGSTHLGFLLSPKVLQAVFQTVTPGGAVGLL